MSSRPFQSRSASMMEAVTNVAVGYAVALLAQQLVFPLFGIVTTLGQDAAIAAAFTLVSLLRSYLVRRLFERLGSRCAPVRRLGPGACRVAEES